MTDIEFKELQDKESAQWKKVEIAIAVKDESIKRWQEVSQEWAVLAAAVNREKMRREILQEYVIQH